MFFKFSAIKVGSKNGTTFNPKLHQKRDASWHRFCIPFGANLVRFRSSKSMKNRCREASKRHQILNRFLYRFLMIFQCLLVANLLPTWRPRRARTAPGATQEASKIEAKWSSDAKTLQRSIWMRFWMDFESDLGGFSMDFRRILEVILEAFLDRKICLHVPSMFHIPRASLANERAQRAM